MNRQVWRYILLFISVFVSACSKWDLDRIEFTQVITVGVLEVGASSAFLIGDIEGLRAGDVTETGFVYSKTASNESTLQLGNQGVQNKISLRSDTTANRAFAVRLIGLETNATYFFRAYIKLAQEPTPVYGQIDSFSTSSVSLSVLSVNRSNQGCPTTVTVEIQTVQTQSSREITFGLIWSDAEYNDQPTFQNGSFVTGAPDANGVVKLELELECEKVYFIRGGALLAGGIPVLSDVKVVTADPQGGWVRRIDFPGESRQGPCSYSYANTGIIFGGEGTIENVIYYYNSLENDWQRIPTQLGPHLIYGVSFVINETTFIGLGQRSNDICKTMYLTECQNCNDCICNSSNFYIVNTSISTFPGGNRRKAIGITIDGKGYVGGGEDPTGCKENIINKSFNDFWEFTQADIKSVTWERKDNIPGIWSARISPVGFSINNYGYVGLGKNTVGTSQTDFYRFDPSQSSGSQWTQQSDFPNNYQYKGPGFSIKDKGYVLATDDRSSSVELWQFDSNENPIGTWNRMSDLPTNPGGLVQASFVIDNFAYVYLDSMPDNFWMYVPELE